MSILKFEPKIQPKFYNNSENVQNLEPNKCQCQC